MSARTDVDALTQLPDSELESRAAAAAERLQTRIDRCKAEARRSARRAGAGHNHRRRVPVLLDGRPQLHPGGHAWPRALHAEHVHRCLQAHVAVLLVDARAGVLRQTNRHSRIAKLLGITHFVATVNKIDLVDFDETRFTEVEKELRRVAARLGGVDITVIPIAAKHGDNVVHRSDRTMWYQGPTLVEYLEGVELSAPQAEPSKLRLPVQWVSRPTADQRRRYTGRLSAGTLNVGDPIVSLPAGTHSTVTVVDALDDERTTAVAPLSVSIELSDDIDVGRGDVFVSAADDATHPVLARELDATVCWFIDSPLRAGDRLALKQGTRTVRITV